MIKGPKRNQRNITVYNSYNNKIPWGKLIKDVKDQHDKNFKSLTKEIVKNIRKWKNLPHSWTGTIKTVKDTGNPTISNSIQ